MPALVVSYLLSTVVLAAPPALVPVQQDGLRITKPEGFEHLFSPEDRSITMSQGLFTTLRIQWFPVAPELSVNHKQADRMQVQGLEEFARTLADQAPFGAFEHEPGRDLPDDPGRVSQMHYTLLGYRMTVGMYLRVDRGRKHILSGFLFTSEDRYRELGGLDLLTTVAGSARTADDTPDPHPEWYWPAIPPEALARPIEPAATP